MTTVLIVDDDPQLLRALSINLKARDYRVVTAMDGATGLAAAAAELPDVVILDLGLPDLDGSEVVTGLRGWSQVPILVLSARDDPRVKVSALDAGADDYITKPFGMDELLARLRAALRRGVPVPDAPVVRTPDFEIDLAARRVVKGDYEVRLTPTEWHILDLLVRSEGKLVSQRQLLHEVWGPTYQKETNYLRVYLAQLRRKLELDPSAPKYLITEPGIGYRFERGTEA